KLPLERGRGDDAGGGGAGTACSTQQRQIRLPIPVESGYRWLASSARSHPYTGGTMRTRETLKPLRAPHGLHNLLGIAGVHNIELFRGFAAAGLRLIRPRHEQGAGFMADGYARASGRTAACYVITGPGLTNLMTPLAQAYSDSVPVIAVAATLPRA